MNNPPKHTIALNQPLTRFRNPSNRAQPSPSPIMSVQLILPDGHVFTVRSDKPVMLGRGNTAPNGERKIDLDHIRGATEGISRNHALLVLTDGTLFIKDYHSTNGTYVDKTELYPMRNYIVEDGNVLMLGKVKIKVKFVAHAYS